MNALLSATHIPLSTFAFATALSLTKLALHVYIGSTLSTLAPSVPPSIPTPGEGEAAPDGSLPNDPSTETPNAVNNHSRNLKIVFMVISIILGFAVGAYVWIVAKREIAASEGIRSERRRKRRASLRQSRASMRSVEGLGSGREHPHLLARSGSSGQIVELGQDCVPAIDLTSNFSSGSDFVGGAGFSRIGYQDDEEDGFENQALVGNGGGRHHVRSHSRSGSRHISGGGGGGGSSGRHNNEDLDSDESDFLNDDYDDEDDDDMSDMERGFDSDEDEYHNPISKPSPYMSSLVNQNGTEMDVRNPLSRQTHASLGVSQDNSMGWFTENGVDISDNNHRSW
ncbi:hypothetical protein FBU30_010342 [Linnemannia zychae]|nr:hypothetical protein FBU30_010342 [Linnemannia zychae]